MPRSRIAFLSAAVLAPGSPDASPGSGTGAPSVCSTSYLGIPQPGYCNAAVVAERGHLHVPTSILVATRRIAASLQESVGPFQRLGASGTPLVTGRSEVSSVDRG